VVLITYLLLISATHIYTDHVVWNIEYEFLVRFGFCLSIEEVKTKRANVRERETQRERGKMAEKINNKRRDENNGVET